MCSLRTLPPQEQISVQVMPFQGSDISDEEMLMSGGSQAWTAGVMCWLLSRRQREGLAALFSLSPTGISLKFW